MGISVHAARREARRGGEGTGVAARMRKRWQAQEQGEVWALRRGEARGRGGANRNGTSARAMARAGAERGGGAAMWQGRVWTEERKTTQYNSGRVSIISAEDSPRYYMGPP